jgi:uncharacterized protein YjbI with pentapeptide repeats
MSGVILTGAELALSKWRGADLRGARLDRADLSFADFGAADLTWANLEDATLRSADFGFALLSEANLKDALYEPRSQTAPFLLSTCGGLDELRWQRNPTPIYDLRKSFLNDGLVAAGKEVTAAIHRHSQSWLEKVLFDWTCAWGADFLQPLKLIGARCRFFVHCSIGLGYISR